MQNSEEADKVKAAKSRYSNLVVLLVEDEKSHRILLRHSLERGLGVQIEECSTGREAIAAIKRREPNLVILDMNLPDFDGDAVLNRIRKDKHSSHLPVIVCTANSQRKTIERMMEMSINGFIIKPYSAETICKKVQQVFDKFLSRTP